MLTIRATSVIFAPSFAPHGTLSEITNPSNIEIVQINWSDRLFLHTWNKTLTWKSIKSVAMTFDNCPPFYCTFCMDFLCSRHHHCARRAEEYDGGTRSFGHGQDPTAGPRGRLQLPGVWLHQHHEEQHQTPRGVPPPGPHLLLHAVQQDSKILQSLVHSFQNTLVRSVVFTVTLFISKINSGNKFLISNDIV